MACTSAEAWASRIMSSKKSRETGEDSGGDSVPASDKLDPKNSEREHLHFLTWRRWQMLCINYNVRYNMIVWLVWITQYRKLYSYSISQDAFLDVGCLIMGATLTSRDGIENILRENRTKRTRKNEEYVWGRKMLLLCYCILCVCDCTCTNLERIVV